MLSLRLQAISEFIENDSVACDIGTDHAYLPIHLIKTGKCNFVYGSDLRDGPLRMAEKNISKNHLEDKIKLIKSDGFENLKEIEATNYIISGIGGILMTEIMRASPFLHDESKLFILGPQSHTEDLRVFLSENGVEIFKEKCVLEDGKFYVILSCGYTGKKNILSLREKYFGKLEDAGFCKNTCKRLRSQMKSLSFEKDNRAELEALIKSMEEIYDNGSKYL